MHFLGIKLNLSSPTVLCCLILVAFSISAQTTDDAPIKVETTLINIPLVVSDRDGRHVGGLRKEDFTILLDGEKQEIEYFADAEAPVSVAIILDLSGSTRPYIQKIRDAAKAFVEKLNPSDQAAVLTFDQFQKIDVISPLTSDRKKLSSKIGSVRHNFSGFRPDWTRPEISPDMYDAIYQAMTKEFAGVKGRKAVIVLTDGFVVGRTVTPRVFDDTIVEGDAVIYPMMFITRQHVGPGNNSIPTEVLYKLPVTAALNSIAVKTGGRLLIAAKDTDFKSAFQSVGDELRKQYVLGFYPSNTDLGRPRQIALSVNRPDTRIRSKTNIRIKPPVDSK